MIKSEEEYNQKMAELEQLAKDLSDYENENHKVEIDYEELANLWDSRGEELMHRIIDSNLITTNGNLFVWSASSPEQIGLMMKDIIDTNWGRVSIPLEDLDI